MHTNLPLWHSARLAISFFYVGYIPFAPGTFGSFAAVLMFYFAPMASMILMLFLLPIGILAIKRFNKHVDRGDTSEIVIDEVLGQLITFAVGIGIVKLIGHNPYLAERCDGCFVIAYLICFAAFRLFDILKPGPVGWADKNVKGPWGVMLDDIIAGVLAGIASALIFLAF